MRYNIFNSAHLPLKQALLTGCICLSTTADNNLSSANEALQKVEELLGIFNEQITYEALHILPFVFEYEPSIWNNYTSEHDKGTTLSKNLKSLVQSYRKQEKAADKLQVMNLIRESYNEFMLFNFNHMGDEEAVLNEILWRYYSDNVLTQIKEKIDILPHMVKHTDQTTGLSIATAA